MVTIEDAEDAVGRTEDQGVIYKFIEMYLLYLPANY